MPKQYVAENTSSMFYIPKTLASDFDEFLDNDIPNTVMPFTLLHDWYDQFDNDYIAKYVRMEIYPDSTKSRYVDTDNNMNVRASVSSGIQKGDIVIDPSGTNYVLDWEVALESNNAPSRALRCNMELTITRHRPEVVDSRGFLVTEEGEDTIVYKLPCNAYRYEGRPEYSAIASTPGISPNALTRVTVQYNDKSKNIRNDDRFVWGNETYVVIDVDNVGVSLNREHGTLILQAKKLPGGEISS